MVLVLVVDDNEKLRLIFRMMLKDYEIIEAENGLVGIEIYEKRKPDLILMDILMPVMDGIEATRKIVSTNPNVKILGITAYSNRVDELLDAGAKEVIVKPVTKADLNAKIVEYLD